MSTYFVSRHPGAVEWAKRQGIDATIIPHLEAGQIQSGDRVLGTLTFALAAEVVRRGARFFHLDIPLTADLRGSELTCDDLDRLGARLIEYRVEKID